ncbi:glycosyltransferase family 4 protein [Streptomyces albulus]|nr:glycosyltransferase family 4 protein [Streptomyces noursei]
MRRADVRARLPRRLRRRRRQPLPARPRQVTRTAGGCDLLVEVCNGMPYLAPLWHRGPTLCLVNHVHTDLWRMRYPAPAARLGRRLEHWALAGTHRGNLMVAVSDSTAAALRDLGVAPDRIRLVHNGVEEPGPLVPEAPEPLFLAMGRLVEYKRIDLLLRLWERVRPVTGGRLVIVGDGPERARLTALAGPDVTFTGRISEQRKHQLLCSAWLLLHPSLVEGWGLVAMEAAARRTPTLGFDIPGLRDSVEDGTTGLLARGERLRRALVHPGPERPAAARPGRRGGRPRRPLQMEPDRPQLPGGGRGGVPPAVPRAVTAPCATPRCAGPSPCSGPS